MKKIINGRKYDTDTATEIASFCGFKGDIRYTDETLYRKRTGEFFLYGEGGTGSKYAHVIDSSTGTRTPGYGIVPLTEQEAKEWLEANSDAETYEECFGEVAE